jgi:hypothetical protein
VRAGRLIAVLAAVSLAAAVAAPAEVVQDGNVVVAFDGGISPEALPREGTAPVRVSIDSTIRTTDGADPPPQLRAIGIEINREGRVFDRGLPTCRVRRIQPATIVAARRICGGAIVGNGRVTVRVLLANQPPFTFEGPMLVFHAPRVGGERRLLAQVYGSRPPSAFVLAFRIVRRPGEFGTLIRTVLPRSARQWAYVTHFEMRLQRTYAYRGARRSFVSAGCPAPPGFPGAIYKFARGTFEFAGGRKISETLIRDCKVR